MRIKKDKSGILEADLTPMIDMTFQLIAFFMVLINLNEAEQNQTIKLPDSVLAKPPQTPPEFPVTLHMMDDGRVIYAGRPIEIEGMGPFLEREANDAIRRGLEPGEVNVIIRGDMRAKTGKVQELIQKCQENKLEKFSLRVKEKPVF